MDLIHKEIESYIFKHTAPHREAIFPALEKRAQEIGFPIIGPLVGHLLFQYAKLIDARRVLELGSGFGYSALWFTLGMPPSGEIYCTDFDAAHLHALRTNLQKAGRRQQVHTFAGDALEHLQNIQGPFDIILFDLDKNQYPLALEKTWPLLRGGGLFIADNVFWKGRVTEPSPDEATRAIQQFTSMIFAKEDAVANFIPLRDGLLVTLKIQVQE